MNESSCQLQVYAWEKDKALTGTDKGRHIAACGQPATHLLTHNVAPYGAMLICDEHATRYVMVPAFQTLRRLPATSN